MGVHIREQRLPGVGERYDLKVDQSRRVMVVLQADGRRTLCVIEGGAEEPVVSVSLSQDQAVAIAALLTGARFSIDTTEDERIDADEVSVDAVTLGPASPAVGRLVNDIPLLDDSDAAILAIIRDTTPELVEDEQREPACAGDRVVVAARRDRLPDVARVLAG